MQIGYSASGSRSLSVGDLFDIILILLFWAKQFSEFTLPLNSATLSLSNLLKKVFHFSSVLLSGFLKLNRAQ